MASLSRWVAALFLLLRLRRQFADCHPDPPGPNGRMAYNEIEARLVALETLIVELAADLPSGQLMAARGRIKAGLDTLGRVSADDFEGVVRRQALQHLDDAIRRHDDFTEGHIVRPRDG